MKQLIISIGASIGAFLGLFMALLLYRIDSIKKNENRILALLLVNLSVLLIFISLVLSGYIDQSIAHLISPLFFICGPCLYLYIRQYTYPASYITKKDSIHIIPTLIVLTYYIVEFFLAEKIYSVLTFMTHPASTHLVWYAFLCQFSAYLLFSSILLKKLIDKLQKKEWSSIIEISWLVYVLKFFISSMLFLILTTVYDMRLIYSGRGKFWGSEIFFILFATFLICSVSFKGLVNPAIFFGEKNADDNNPRKTLPEKRVREIMLKVKDVMQRDKPYLDPELTLPELAAMTAVPRGELSSAINSHTSKNFYDYINSFRVEEFKELLKASESKVNILDISFSAGFNSKSTFNHVFKKMTNLTPTEYKKTVF